MEWPLGTIRDLQLAAKAADHILIRELGFGLSDLVELALVQMDAELERIANVWPNDIVQDPADPPNVLRAEVMARRGIPSLAESAMRCANPDRAKVAAQWAVTDASGEAFRPYRTSGAVGPWLALQANQTIASSAGLLLGGLECSSRHLMGLAAGKDSKIEARYRRLVAERVGYRMASLGYSGLGPVKVGRGIAHFLTFPANRHLLTVNLATGLTPDRLEKSFDSAVKWLRQVARGRRIVAIAPRDFPRRVEPGSSVVGLVVQSAPGFYIRSDAALTMSLVELEHILSLDSHPDDFYCFLKDLVEPGPVSAIAAWSLADVWHIWRAAGNIVYPGGVPNVVVEVPNNFAGEFEWSRRAEIQQLEQLLADLELPALEEWAHIQWYEDGSVLASGVRPRELWLIRYRPPQLAILVMGPDDDWQKVENQVALGSVLILRAEHSQAFARVLERSSGRRSGVVALALGSKSRLASLGRTVDGYLHFSPAALNLKQTPIQFQRRLGRSVSRALGPRLKDADRARLLREFHEEWDSLPPAFKTHAEVLFHAAQRPGLPEDPNEHFRTKWMRELAINLHAQRRRRGRYRGPAYVHWQSTIAYPELRRLLKQAMSAYDARELLRVSGVERERVLAQRFQGQGRMYASAGLPEPEARLDFHQRIEQEGTRLSRTIGLLIEETLADPPAGPRRLDRLDWATLVALAEVTLQTSLLSQSVHYGLEDRQLEVDRYFSIHDEFRGPGKLGNVAAWLRARTLDVQSTTPNDHLAGEQRPVALEIPKALRTISQALKEELGFGLEALVAVLAELRGWDVDDRNPIAAVKRETVVARCAKVTGVSVAEVEAAIARLTLRGQDLAAGELEHWKQETRTYRLANRPLIDLDDGRLLVMPWGIGYSLQIYVRYLMDGRLPWAEVTMPKGVKDALDRYRQNQNRQLEVDVANRLREAGWPVHTRIKDPRRLGLQSLYGEIDVLTIDPVTRQIWVLEVKDPAEPFSAPEMARSVRRFHGPDGHVLKLLKKLRDVRRRPHRVAKSLGVDAPRGRVRGLVVTRNHELAAHVKGSRVEFVVVHHLIEYLNGSDRGAARP